MKQLDYIEAKIAEYGALLEKYMIARSVLLEAQAAIEPPKPKVSHASKGILPPREGSVIRQVEKLIKEKQVLSSQDTIKALGASKQAVYGAYNVLKRKGFVHKVGNTWVLSGQEGANVDGQ